MCIRDSIKRSPEEVGTNPSESDSDTVRELRGIEELSTASSSGAAAKDETTPEPAGTEAPLDMISFIYVAGDTPKGTIYVQFEPRHVWFKPYPGNDWVENRSGWWELCSNGEAWMIHFDPDATNQVAAEENTFSYIYMCDWHDPLPALHRQGYTQRDLRRYGVDQKGREIYMVQEHDFTKRKDGLYLRVNAHLGSPKWTGNMPGVPGHCIIEHGRLM